MTEPDHMNPKDLIGAKKVPMTALPLTAVLQANRAMVDGAKKYGPYNWRGKKVRASIYVDAAFRHIGAYFDGQDLADDSKCLHLAHGMCCLAILIDAMETGNLIDDRPPGGKFSEVLVRLNAELGGK